MIAPRTHSYAAIFFVGLVFISIKIIVSASWSRYVYIGFTIFIVMLSATFIHKSRFLLGEKYSGETADLFADTMLKTSNGTDTCYTFDMAYLANIQLKYALHKRQLTVYQSDPGSPSSAKFSFANNYNWVITPTNNLVEVSTDTLNSLYHNKVTRSDATLWERNKR